MVSKKYFCWTYYSSAFYQAFSNFDMVVGGGGWIKTKQKYVKFEQNKRLSQYDGHNHYSDIA